MRLVVGLSALMSVFPKMWWPIMLTEEPYHDDWLQT